MSRDRALAMHSRAANECDSHPIKLLNISVEVVVNFDQVIMS